MNTKKLSLLFIILLTLILVGAGCSDSDQVAPAEDQAAESADKPDDSAGVGQDDDYLDEEDSGDESADVGDDDEFEGWKTYEQDGIILKYPENWRVTDDGAGLYRWQEGLEEAFANQDYFEYIDRMAEVSISIIVRENTGKDDVDNLVKYVDYHETLERTYVDGHGALLVTCGGINYMECLLLNNKEDSVIIVISYMFTDDSDSAGIEKEINQILQTVRLP